MYALFLTSFIFELLVVIRRRNDLVGKLLAIMAVATITFPVSALLALDFSIAWVVMVLVSGVRFLNVVRIIEGRMHPLELRMRVWKTYMSTLLPSVAVFLYIVLIDDVYAVSIDLILYSQLFVAVLLGLSVLFARTIYRYRTSKEAPEKLPTVSVCIPARNETNDLPDCISAVLSSTYPKLEILVLDDCSHDKTPEIVKGFAHAGVRFVNGKEPRADWLAKNAAYDRLADEAKGDILLFIGVDVRMQPESIMELVKQINADDMISVLPRRAASKEAAVFIQPLRYWWELGLWRFSSGKPPVLSTCWAIRAEALRRLGTFESVKKAVEPEAVFAHVLADEKKYAFLVANDTVAVESVKGPKEQYNTALRKRYPQLRRRPELVLLVALFEALFILLPFGLLVWSIAVNEPIAVLVTALTVAILVAANTEVYKLSLRKMWPLGIISMPALVLADWGLMLRSMYAYEFGKVIWKERNICLPLLTVEKSLPKLD
jgi:hypothetical protein